MYCPLWLSSSRGCRPPWALQAGGDDNHKGLSLRTYGAMNWVGPLAVRQHTINTLIEVWAATLQAILQYRFHFVGLLNQRVNFH